MGCSEKIVVHRGISHNHSCRQTDYFFSDNGQQNVFSQSLEQTT